MKVIVYLMVLLVVVSSCQSSGNGSEDNNASDSTDVSIGAEMTFPEKAKNMTIYEVNIRQHTPAGTLNALIEDIPRLKDLGAEILWLMPVQPIGKKNRKGSLGSYYSIQNYREVNPEFGTLDDFKRLVEVAHEAGLYVILDWVPNHTAWDHPWITEHPEYYAKDEEGQITYEADWTDIARLDYSNKELWEDMKAEMEFWIRETDIDGFRCDHAAHEIPMEFWNDCIPYLNKVKDLFWLAEWDDPKLHPPFHASYNWSLFHKTYEVARGDHEPDELIMDFEDDIEQFGREPFRMIMTTNHDENSWNGTVFERYGEAHKTFAVFTFTVGGIPLIYSGQEAGLDHRLKFFEKDTIDWTDPRGLTDFYVDLIDLRQENRALWSGIYGGATEFLKDDNENVIVYQREKDNNKVTVILNIYGETEEVEIEGLPGNVVDYFSGKEVNLNNSLTLEPYQYCVYISKN